MFLLKYFLTSFVVANAFMSTPSRKTLTPSRTFGSQIEQRYVFENERNISLLILQRKE